MLVTCIMPTANRLRFVPQAIRYFQAQSWPECELVMVDSSDEPLIADAGIVDALQSDDRIRWLRGTQGMLVGDARNMAVEAARADIICHWDDDDWYGVHRVTDQVAALLRQPLPVVGSPSLIFADDRRRAAWRYRYEGPDYGVGVSLMYRKSAWRSIGGFKHDEDGNGPVPWAEDVAFCRELAGRIHQAETDQIVARIHPKNTCPKTDEKLATERWSPVDWAELERMGYEVSA